LVFPRDKDKGTRICQALEDSFFPKIVIYRKDEIEEVLERFEAIIAIMAVGIVVRLICPLLKDKWQDTPVVAVDSALSCAVPVVGGHHGANQLACLLHFRLGLYPAITTATDSSGRPCLEEMAKRLGSAACNPESSKAINLAFLNEDVPVLRLKGPKIVLVDQDVAVLKLKGLVLGIGARKGVAAQEVLSAVDQALEEAGKSRDDIAILATADLKREEVGMVEAAGILGKELICLPPKVLNAQAATTPSRAQDLGLVGVAEPAVLALARRLIAAKKAYGRVTIAIGE
jgi:cobalt-precorrin 5A hydrolase